MVVSISIVNYNTWDDVLRCVAAILEERWPDYGTFEILIHDNGRTPPPSPAPFLEEPNVYVHRSDQNIGYGAGHNANFCHAKGEVFVILNPDVEPFGGSLLSLADALGKDAGISAVAPQLVLANGRVQYTCRRLPSMLRELMRVTGLEYLPIARGYGALMREWDHSKTREVEQVAGAAIAVRSGDFAKIGGFDERYLMYFEDVDLCARLRALGPVVYLATVRMVHQGESTARLYRAATTFLVEWSRQCYYRIHESRRGVRMVVRTLCILGAAGRSMLLRVLSLVACRQGRRAELRAKARGYSMFVSTVVHSDESYWRRRLMSDD